MENDFSVIGFIKAIPPMLKKVWPGLWPLVLIVSAILFFSSPEHLDVLSFSEWLDLHLLVVFGMVTISIWLYNTYPRPVVNMIVIGLWLLASACCVFGDLLLKGI